MIEKDSNIFAVSLILMEIAIYNDYKKTIS